MSTGFEYMAFKKEYRAEHPEAEEMDVTKAFLIENKDKVNYDRYKATCPMLSQRCNNIQCEDCELFIPPEELGIETKLPDPPGLCTKAEFDKLTGEIVEFNQQINMAFTSIGEDLTRANVKIALLHNFIKEIGDKVGATIPADLNALVEQELKHVHEQQQALINQMKNAPVIPGMIGP